MKILSGKVVDGDYKNAKVRVTLGGKIILNSTSMFGNVRMSTSKSTLKSIKFKSKTGDYLLSHVQVVIVFGNGKKSLVEMPYVAYRILRHGI